MSRSAAFQIGKGIPRRARSAHARFREFYQADIDVAIRRRLSWTTSSTRPVPSVIYKTFPPLAGRLSASDPRIISNNLARRSAAFSCQASV
ncbi:MAG: hypothetical protein ACLR4Z_03575 [Butyricicoccaceae bacterium]